MFLVVTLFDKVVVMYVLYLISIQGESLLGHYVERYLVEVLYRHSELEDHYFVV